MLFEFFRELATRASFRSEAIVDIVSAFWKMSTKPDQAQRENDHTAHAALILLDAIEARSISSNAKDRERRPV
jgi:hypothetical protein